MAGELEQEDVDRIAGALYAGHKIEAIKLYRAVTGADLKTARDVVLGIEKGLSAESPEKFIATPQTGGGATVLGLLVLCLIVAGGVWFFWAKADPKPPPPAPREVEPRQAAGQQP